MFNTSIFCSVCLKVLSVDMSTAELRYRAFRSWVSINFELPLFKAKILKQSRTCYSFAVDCQLFAPGHGDFSPTINHKERWFRSSLTNRLWSRGTKLEKVCCSASEEGWEADRLLSDTSLSQSVPVRVQSSNTNKSNSSAFSACLHSVNFSENCVKHSESF